jgi:hydroxymethylbilane synthase
LRRQAQLRHIRSDWLIDEVRGNVDTRLRKLDHGDYDALILAAAGLMRLDLAGRISVRLEPPVMYPAVGQGAIGIECRTEDIPLQHLLRNLTSAETWAEVTAERSLLGALRAGCHAPLGVATWHLDDVLHLEAVVLSPDGVKKWTAAGSTAAVQAVELGHQVAQDLLDQGAGEVLRSS